MAQARWVLIGRLAMPVSAFLLLIVLGRHSDQLLGEYALVTTFYFVMQTLPLLGLTPFVMRGVARDPRAAGDYFVTIGLLSLVGCVAVNAVARAVLVATPYSIAVEHGVHIVGYGIFCGILVFLAEIILISLGRAREMAITTSAENLLRLVVSVIVLIRGGDVVQLIWVVFGTRVLSLLVYLLLLRRAVPLPRRPDWGILRNARAVLPVFATSAVLVLVMSRMDVFVLSWHTTTVELGYYAIAYRLLEIFMLGVLSVTTALFPRMARQYVEDRRGYLNSCRLLVPALLALLVPVAIAAHAGSGLYVRLLFAGQYPEAVVLSGLVVLLLPLAGLDALCSSMLNASDKQTSDLRATMVGGVVQATGLMVLVPMLLGVGAFVSLVLAMTVQAGLRLRAFRRRFGPVLGVGDLAGHALLGLGTLWMVDHLLREVDVFEFIGLCLMLMLIYPTILIVTGLFRPLRLLGRVWPTGQLRPAHSLRGLLDRLVADERARQAWLSETGQAPSRYENWALTGVVLYRVARWVHLRGWHRAARLISRFNRVLTRADLAPEVDIGPGRAVASGTQIEPSGDVDPSVSESDCVVSAPPGQGHSDPAPASVRSKSCRK
ncbi:MAG: oligosaccharide flippase family protein [Panacagrimonas sp.]